tara:strand:- start:658 stop:879 length:222 start_codon:yes stop_codon:yes gene_type:complete
LKRNIQAPSEECINSGPVKRANDKFKNLERFKLFREKVLLPLSFRDSKKSSMKPIGLRQGKYLTFYLFILEIA